MKLTRPALRYLGGKWKLAPWIIGNMPPHDIYVEPFGGAASVLLRKDRAQTEVYNDLDGDVVNLFRVLRDQDAALELCRLVSLTPFARGEWASAYEPAEAAVERARRLLVRSFMGFGSCGSRAARSTSWRTGIRYDSRPAANEWAGLPPHLFAICERLRGVSIEGRPALDVLANYDRAGTFFYVDPPYVHETRSAKRTRGALSNGYTHELSPEDHRILLGRLLGMQGMVAVSGYECRLYDDALVGGGRWARLERQTHADGARPRSEVLWLNPPAFDALQRSRATA